MAHRYEGNCPSDKKENARPMYFQKLPGFPLTLRWLTFNLENSYI